MLVDLASLLIERNDNEADGDDYDDATGVGPVCGSAEPHSIGRQEQSTGGKKMTMKMEENGPNFKRPAKGRGNRERKRERK